MSESGGSSMASAGAAGLGAGGAAGSSMGSGGSGVDAVGQGGSSIAEGGSSLGGGGSASMGAGGSSMAEPSPSMDQEPPCDAVTEVFEISCATGGGCHNAIGVGNFALGPEQAAAYLGEGPTFNVDSCGLMIDPVRPDRSMILTKVTLDPPYDEDDCGLPMPSNGTVTPDQVECLRSWVEQFRGQ